MHIEIIIDYQVLYGKYKFIMLKMGSEYSNLQFLVYEWNLIVTDAV